MMLPTEIKLCCKVLGRAMRTISPRMRRENRRARSSSMRIFASLRSTKYSASRQLIPWHRKVAQATPATPILNAVTNRISMAMLDSEEQARKIKGVLESPMAEKMPSEIL